MVIWGYIGSLAYGIVCLLISLLAYRLGMPKRYTRKIVHILVGFEWVILYHLMGVGIHFVAVALIFTAMLFVSYKKSLMPMISSDNDNAPGTVYYAVAMSVMSLITLFVPDMMFPFGIGVFCTSFGDGFAGVVGQSIKKYNPKVFRNKTLYGALANFLFSFATCLVFKNVFEMGLSVWQCVLIAFLGMLLELLGVYGLDNIFVTLGTSFLAYSFINFEWLEGYYAPIVLTPLVIILVIQKKALTKKALILALILDLAVSLSLGDFGFVLLLSFLVGGILVDKVKALRKREDTITKKGDCRDSIQVIANGLIPMAMAVLFASTFNPVFIVAYVAVLGEAFSDTAASGIGVFSKKTYDIFRFKKGVCGLSGGVSLIGTAAALIASVLFSLLAVAFGIRNVEIILIIITSSFCGMLFDSLLGSLFQVKYKCSVCASLTEREQHCSKPAKIYSGYPFFDNDVVNVLSGAFSAGLSILLYTLIL